MTVELPEEVVAFLSELATEIKNQNNRATASPYYFIVRGQREVVAPDNYGDGETHYYCSEWIEGHTREEWIDVLAQHDDEHETKTDLDEFLRDKCERFGMHLVDVEENFFLTERGYKRHMELNGHNYRHLKNVHSYVKYTGRNPEIKKLLEAIACFDGIITNPTGDVTE